MATDAQLQPTLVQGGLDEFLELEAKISRAAEAMRQAHDERERAESRMVQLQAAHEKLQHAYMQAELELAGLRKGRNDIRQRVGKLVKQLDGAVAER